MCNEVIDGGKALVETVFELPIANVYSCRKANHTVKRKASSARDRSRITGFMASCTRQIHYDYTSVLSKEINCNNMADHH